MLIQVVDPWGKVLADLGSKDSSPSYKVVEINLREVERVRKSMPVLDHRRNALYDLREPTFRFPADDTAVFDFGQVKVPGSTVFLVSKHAYAFVNKKCVRPGRE